MSALVGLAALPATEPIRRMNTRKTESLFIKLLPDNREISGEVVNDERRIFI